jgi:hypothetical protein
MVDDVILNKIAIIERCVRRTQEEYQKDIEGFFLDYTAQSASVILPFTNTKIYKYPFLFL